LRAKAQHLASFLALVIALSAVSPAHAWTYGDTLTTIWRPLPNLPAFSRPGDTFTVWANAGSGVTGWADPLGETPCRFESCSRHSSGNGFAMIIGTTS
jgi:hypothetical protein